MGEKNNIYRTKTTSKPLNHHPFAVTFINFQELFKLILTVISHASLFLTPQFQDMLVLKKPARTEKGNLFIVIKNKPKEFTKESMQVNTRPTISMYSMLLTIEIIK